MPSSYLKLFLDCLEKYQRLDDAEFGRLIRAALAYKSTGTSPTGLGREELLWDGLRMEIDRDNESYADKVRARSEAGKLGAASRWQTQTGDGKNGKCHSCDGKNGQEEEKEKEEEKDKEKYISPNGEKRAPAKEAKKSFGTYGWVKLTDSDYNRLINDLGEAEVKRCIAYVDESAQSTGNKNRWRDWNLTVRRCHRDGWGIRPGGKAPAPKPSTQPSAKTVQETGAWMEKFLDSLEDDG